MTDPNDPEATTDTFPMRVAARLTGVSPERMRAWESRHGAVVPLRTAGGSRRYTHSDLERLTLLRRAVEAGHRIREIARLDAAELEARLAKPEPEPDVARHEALLAAIQRLDESEIRARLEAERDALGSVAFARDTVLGLARAVGDRWAAGSLPVATEHLATSIMRSMLAESLGRTPDAGLGPKIVFATPQDERHDLGLLVAAVLAKHEGATPIFVGADVPEADLVATVRTARAEALALGFVTLPRERVESVLRSVRRALPPQVAIWAGGAGIAGCAPVRGVDRIENLDRLPAYLLELPSGRLASSRARSA